MKRLKILMSAYACEPDRSSEAGVGWNVAQEVAKYHDVWVITRRNNQATIEDALKRKPVPNLRFVYYDLPRWSRLWKKGTRGIQAYYHLWQLGSANLAGKLHKKINFDVAHHVTFVRYWSPSSLARLPVPLIWGSVGGGESTPKTFYSIFTPKDRRYELLRDLARWLGEQDPLVRLTARKSKLAIATTEETAERLRALGAENIQVLEAIGLSEEELSHLTKLPLPCRSGEPVRFISIGRLLHWKGFALGLRAFAEARVPDSEYWIIGDGPDLQRLRALARDLSIEKQVHFWGRLSRHETFEKLGDCHVVVHPSLHDSGGFACLEAMAAGRPVICLDLGGPALQITEDTGFKIPAHEPKQAVTDLARAMQTIAGDSKLGHYMGVAARKRVTENYSWEKKGLMLRHIYEKALDVYQ